MLILNESMIFEKKLYQVIDDNLFFNTKENILIEPVYPLAPNVLSKTLRSMIEQVNKNEDPFKHLAYNIPNSLVAYAIVDNQPAMLKALLTNKYVTPNTIILNHDKTSMVGRPLDVAVDSILRSQHIDNVLYLIQKGARSDHEEELIKRLELKATRSEDPNLSFRLLTVSNLLKVLNGIYSPEYMEKTITSNQISIAFEGEKAQVDAVLSSDSTKKLDWEGKNNILNLIESQNQLSLRESKFLKEKLGEVLNVSSDLLKNTKESDYNLLFSGDHEIMKNYPRSTMDGISNSISQENWRALEQNVANAVLINNEYEFNLSPNVIKFLIYQSMEDMEKINKHTPSEEINYTTDLKENVENMNKGLLEELKLNVSIMSGNKIHVYNDLLPKDPLYNKSEKIIKFEKHYNNTESLDLSKEIDKDIKEKKGFFKRLFGM